MGEYEELVELGFEGVDKAVNKYHDRAFDKLGKHSSVRHRRHDSQQQHKGYSKPPASEASYAEHKPSRNPDEGDTESKMYAPDRRQERDYQDRRDSPRDSRYVSDESFYYRGPDAGAMVMRSNDPYNSGRGYEVQPFQQPQYDNRRDDFRGRPQHQRRRSSWSPQRNGRDRGNDRRARSRSRSRSKDRHNRIAATVAGGLIGGLLGNQVQKGRKYDTAATIAGAVIGGLGAREVSEQWDKRRARREDCDEKWEEKYGDDRDSSRRDDRRREDRYGR